MPAMTGIQHTPPPSADNVSPKPLRPRPNLPEKSVTSTSIEDAYINFILYCNPAVPLETDTGALGEAFRVPPKSDGKAFSTFTLFELIKKLHTKELKTWADLAVNLGVTPPDTQKGQSSQKIQQYAVRLKRWMHSMHVDAFFDYLLDNEHPYFTQVPTDPNPVCEEGRDGVAAEDDMALRSLLPQIRPRRGRRKPEDDLNKSPSQRPRLESPNLNSEGSTQRQNGSEPWTAHPDGQRTFLFPPADEARSSVLPGSGSGFPWPSELSQTPMTAYPQSAMTPINGRGLWADEPLSAITPSKAKQLGRRHGAKVVSSAWRSGGSIASGKTRGRPPINRGPDVSFSATPDASHVFHGTNFDKDAPRSAHPLTAPVPIFPSAPTSAPTSTPSSVPTPTSAGPSQASRPGRPGRLSLQVPERQGGNVRLATPPPPVVMVNGQSTGVDESSHVSGPTMTSNAITASSTTQTPCPSMLAMTPNGPPGDISVHPQDESTVNVREVESLFVSELLIADWFDASGNKIPPCGFDEAEAMAKMIIGNMQKQALTPESFLSNLAILAGGSVLQKGVKATITRIEDGPNSSKYTCKWGLRYGVLRGNFSLTETVPHSLWKEKEDELEMLGNETAEHGDAQHWKKKYQELLRAVKTNHQHDTDLRLSVLESLKRSK
ncbi:putative ARS binding protein 2-domain-containing protein [Seiridium cardinale]